MQTMPAKTLTASYKNTVIRSKGEAQSDQTVMSCPGGCRPFFEVSVVHPTGIE